MSQDKSMLDPLNICLPCRQGFTEECENYAETNCLEVASKTEKNKDKEVQVLGGPEPSIEKQSPGRPRKADEDIQDVRSTGRKRANVDFPRNPEADCEWKGLIHCGGGKHPIPGCTDGKQETTHHGDKNKLNNTIGNVHRICYRCHNRWHAVNDKDFDPGIPHEPISLILLKEQIQLMIKYNPEALKELVT
jgi:hypothetical protein